MQYYSLLRWCYDDVCHKHHQGREFSSPCQGSQGSQQGGLVVELAYVVQETEPRTPESGFLLAAFYSTQTHLPWGGSAVFSGGASPLPIILSKTCSDPRQGCSSCIAIRLLWLTRFRFSIPYSLFLRWWLLSLSSLELPCVLCWAFRVRGCSGFPGAPRVPTVLLNILRSDAMACVPVGSLHISPNTNHCFVWVVVGLVFWADVYTRSGRSMCWPLWAFPSSCAGALEATVGSCSL